MDYAFPSNEALIEHLVERGYLRTPSVIDAFRAINRADFVPPAQTEEAYGNYPLPIGFGQTISQPLTVALMLEWLAPQPGDTALDIGSGSGWQTTLLAYIVSGGYSNGNDGVGPRKGKRPSSGRNISGFVVGVERLPELAEMTKRNISKYNFVDKGAVEVICADGSKGYRSRAPYDKIVTAASAPFVPEALKEQLAVGGRLVAPVGQSIVVLDKKSEGDFDEREHFGFSFVPLISG